MHQRELCCSLAVVPRALYGAKAKLMQSNARSNPFGKAISKCKLFFCQLRYELSSRHQRDWCNLLLLIWLKGKVVATHKIQSINFVSQQLCKQMACENKWICFLHWHPAGVNLKVTNGCENNNTSLFSVSVPVGITPPKCFKPGFFFLHAACWGGGGYSFGSR